MRKVGSQSPGQGWVRAKSRAKLGRIGKIEERFPRSSHPKGFSHARKFIETVRKYIGEQAPDRTAPGFLDAWQPDDPIPKEYKEHRKAKFPKKT